MTDRQRLFATLGLFTALAAIHTWPLASAPATWCRNDNADAILNEWTLGWVAHVIRHQPFALFDANIFHPEPRALAFSEHLVPQALLVAPLVWLGASLVLAYNVAWFAGLVFTGAATCHVLTRWTGCWSGGIVAGSTVAFSSYVLTNTPHVQVAHVEFLPLALLALDRTLASRRVVDGLRLGAFTALQMLCSGYLLVFTATAIVASLGVRLREWVVGPERRQALGVLALGGLVALIVTGPFLLPYWRVRTSQHLVRTLEEAAVFSASPSDYLSTAARFHYAWWSSRFYPPVDTWFPGALALLLAGWSLVAGIAWRDRRARMLLATGLAGFLLSFGPSIPLYRWLHAGLPLLQGIRAPSRFGVLVLLAVGGLAAFGWAALVARLEGRGPRLRAVAAALPVVLVVLVNAELLRAPLGFVRFAGIPSAYDALATERGAVVAEFPFPDPASFQLNAAAMLGSTRHWQRLLNGYSGFVPASYERHAAELADFPSEGALDALARAGVTHVVVQVGRAPDVARAVERDQAHFRLMVASDGVQIYRFTADAVR